jgi:hypothetical protein
VQPSHQPDRRYRLPAHLRERPVLSYPYNPAVPSNPAARYYLKLIKHTGALILWQQRSYTVSGTLEECQAAYRAAQTHNLVAGWWSLVSLFLMNWVAQISNLSAIRQVRAMAKAGVAPQTPLAAPTPASIPAGWYPDPSRAGQRYWDGATWTHWTHPPSHR